MENKSNTANMKAVRFHDFDGPEKLIIDHLNIPDPNPDEVLVKIHTTAVNPMDWKLRSGMAKSYMTIQLPYIPGIEASGTVESIGKNVKEFRTGQEVFGNIRNSYAEYAVVNSQSLFPKPSHYSLEEAATLPVGTQTAWASLFDVAGLKKGQTVLIQGAAGSVGIFAVQFAKIAGATVIATVSGGNVQFIKTLGADEVIDHTSQNFENLVKNVDVVFDSIGGDVQERSLNVIKKGGILVSIAGIYHEDKAKNLGIRIQSRTPGLSDTGANQIRELINSGRIKTAIRETFPLEQASKAHELGEKMHGRGKIILRVM
jgi:NADPH:quinone reductase-like Zn-dependent oxidoreductase